MGEGTHVLVIGSNTTRAKWKNNILRRCKHVLFVKYPEIRRVLVTLLNVSHPSTNFVFPYFCSSFKYLFYFSDRVKIKIRKKVGMKPGDRPLLREHGSLVFLHKYYKYISPILVVYM